MPKIEMFTFSTKPEVLVMGKVRDFDLVSVSPDRSIEANRAFLNAAVPGMVHLTYLSIGDTLIVGKDREMVDAYDFRPSGEASFLRPPVRFLRGMIIRMRGSYTGLVPDGYAEGFPYQFIVSIYGPEVLNLS